MQLELTKIIYGSINSTLHNCLELVSDGNVKKQQKVVVGDADGNLQLFSIKKSEVKIGFQVSVGSNVLSIQMSSGVPGSASDRIFVASDNVIKAFTKKGKMFFSFDTNLTEPIKCMFISGADLFICGNHVYSHYRDYKEMGSYLCGDQIVDVVALSPHNTNRILTILACSGRVLRILEYFRVWKTIEVDSIPTVLHVPKNVLNDRILCGFADGKIILYQFGSFTGEIKQKTMIDVSSNGSAISCIDTYDLSRNGCDDLIIGRRDGSIQVFSTNADSEIDVECRLLYQESFMESILSVRGGCVFSQGWPEIVVLLYSGKIYGLTTQVMNISLSKDNFKQLEKYSTSSDLSARTDEDTNIPTSSSNTFDNIKLNSSIQKLQSPGLTLQVNDSLTLDKLKKTYNLFIEIPMEISEIVLESEIMLNIVEDKKDYNIEKFSNAEFNFTWKIKIQENCNRFEMEFRTIEGQYGSFHALIIPRYQAQNVQIRTFTIRPLSLHFRTHTFDSTRPLNVLSLKGLFSISEIHNWIAQCIPEVPERLSAAEVADLFFENSLIGTILECKYGKGNAQFRSDNLSTISILKDFLTKEATKKRIELEIMTDISEESVAHVLWLIKNSIDECIKTKKDYTFLQALLQVDIRNDEDFNCLMPEYQSILNRREQIEHEFEKTPAILDKYFGTITDFYVDRFKFQGICVRDKISQLLEILENFNMDELLKFFNTSMKTY